MNDRSDERPNACMVFAVCAVILALAAAFLADTESNARKRMQAEMDLIDIGRRDTSIMDLMASPIGATTTIDGVEWQVTGRAETPIQIKIGDALETPPTRWGYATRLRRSDAMPDDGEPGGRWKEAVVSIVIGRCGEGDVADWTPAEWRKP